MPGIYADTQIIDLPTYLHPLPFPFDLCKLHWFFRESRNPTKLFTCQNCYEKWKYVDEDFQIYLLYFQLKVK